MQSVYIIVSAIIFFLQFLYIFFISRKENTISLKIDSNHLKIVIRIKVVAHRLDECVRLYGCIASTESKRTEIYIQLHKHRLCVCMRARERDRGRRKEWVYETDMRVYSVWGSFMANVCSLNYNIPFANFASSSSPYSFSIFLFISILHQPFYNHFKYKKKRQREKYPFTLNYLRYLSIIYFNLVISFCFLPAFFFHFCYFLLVRGIRTSCHIANHPKVTALSIWLNSFHLVHYDFCFLLYSLLWEQWYWALVMYGRSGSCELPNDILLINAYKTGLTWPLRTFTNLEYEWAYHSWPIIILLDEFRGLYLLMWFIYWRRGGLVFGGVVNALSNFIA